MAANLSAVVPQYLATKKCALCRILFGSPNLHDYERWATMEREKRWPFVFDRLLPVYQRKDQPGHCFMAILDIRTKNDYDREIVPIGCPDVESSRINLRIGPRASNIDAKTEAVTVHQTCWKLANDTVNGKLSNQMIFAWKDATEFIVYSETSRYPNHDPSYYSDVTLGYDATTRLGRLLASLALLPKEIKLQISKHLTHHNVICHFAAAIRVINTSHALLGARSLRHHERARDFIFGPTARSISVTWVNIYDHRYLSELVTSEEEPGLQNTDFLRLRPLGGIRFALGKFGIRGIKILYKDKSESKWMGDLSDCSFGTILGDDIIGLRVLRDSLKILRIDLIKRKIAASNLQQWLWKSEVSFSSTQKHYLRENVRNDWIRSTENIKHYDDWGLGRYLSFIQDGEYIPAVTIVLSSGCVGGIFAHGRKTVKGLGGWGYHSASAIHFPLQESEKISSIWVCREEENHPAILLVTTLGRTCIGASFKSCRTGPRLLSGSVYNTNSSRWFLITNDSQSPITGIFSDDLHDIRGVIRRFGATKEISSSLIQPSALPILPVLTTNSKEPYPGERERNKILTIASFNTLKKLEISHIHDTALETDGRRSGLLIHHTDGLIEALGQWNPNYKSKTTIYESKDGPIHYIKFGMKITYPRNDPGILESLDYIHVEVRKTSTLPLLGQDVGDNAFYLQDLSKPVEWWYSDHFDRIQYWEGRFDELPCSENQVKEIHFAA